ncbi:MAG: hypothetical protein COT74_05060 [Bdellovibrionales bacterium CG10_big_fil_rev_8_21_14_0_10_45_34]|nr:MAG: hypothetical protein COT74_05060 [Bdellovibrionales bacterium CG10_big_fil_rev_8_21_14_0_10_45_34]
MGITSKPLVKIILLLSLSPSLWAWPSNSDESGDAASESSINSSDTDTEEGVRGSQFAFIKFPFTMKFKRKYNDPNEDRSSSSTLFFTMFDKANFEIRDELGRIWTTRATLSRDLPSPEGRASFVILDYTSSVIAISRRRQKILISFSRIETGRVFVEYSRQAGLSLLLHREPKKFFILKDLVENDPQLLEDTADKSRWRWSSENQEAADSCQTLFGS